MATCEDTSPQDVVCPEQDAAAKPHTIMEEYGYKIGKVIGTGSYGLVYEALLEKQKIQVAVKIISKKKAAGEYLNKFLPREVQVMKTLRHRHIINFYQAIETTSRVYLVLELAPSGDAVERLQKVGPLPECLAGKWFAQLARGMAYIHSKGIVHRDLKLENLLLDKKSNIKISDFGFAKVATAPCDGAGNIYSQCNLSQTYCGSYAYVCPEALMGQPYNPFLSDVWSMGVILYAFLTATMPFDDTKLRRLVKSMQEQVCFPTKRVISDEAKILVWDMLKQAPHRITVLAVLRSQWVLNHLPEKPEAELKALEAFCDPLNLGGPGTPIDVEHCAVKTTSQTQPCPSEQARFECSVPSHPN